VRGKGNRQRAVPVGNAAPALADWLAIRGEEAGPLFWGLGNRNRRSRLTDQAIYKMLRKRARMAGVSRLSPHDFRRTFVGDLLDAGADIVTVQKMAGHASPATTSPDPRLNTDADDSTDTDCDAIAHIDTAASGCRVIQPTLASGGKLWRCGEVSVDRSLRSCWQRYVKGDLRSPWAECLPW